MSLSISTDLIFTITSVLCVILFYFATNKSLGLLLLIAALGAIQGLLATSGFFLITDTLPPRIMLVILPAIVLIIFAFTTKKGKALIDSFDIERYTYLHAIRILVEIVILRLFLEGSMPKRMSFEGRNFDIFSGITAPLIAYFGFNKKILNKKIILGWNILCLLLVLQVVITGILSVPSPIQKLSFDQPNVAVLYFPYIWLPGIIVPIVILGHFVSIRHLIKKN